MSAPDSAPRGADGRRVSDRTKSASEDSTPSSSALPWPLGGTVGSGPPTAWNTLPSDLVEVIADAVGDAWGALKLVSLASFDIIASALLNPASHLPASVALAPRRPSPAPPRLRIRFRGCGRAPRAPASPATARAAATRPPPSSSSSAGTRVGVAGPGRAASFTCTLSPGTWRPSPLSCAAPAPPPPSPSATSGAAPRAPPRLRPRPARQRLAGGDPRGGGGGGGAGGAVPVVAVALRFTEGEAAREGRGGALLAALIQLAAHFPSLLSLRVQLPYSRPPLPHLHPPDPSRALCLLCLPHSVAAPGAGPSFPLLVRLDAPLHVCDPAHRRGPHAHSDEGLAALRALFPALRAVSALVLLAPRPAVAGALRGPLPAAERLELQSLAAPGPRASPEEQQARERAWLRSLAPLLNVCPATELRVVDARHTRTRALHRGVMESLRHLTRLCVYVAHVWDYSFLQDAVAPPAASGPPPLHRIRFLHLRLRLWLGRSRHDFASVGQLVGRLCCTCPSLEEIHVEGVPWESLERLGASSGQHAALVANWKLAVHPFISAFREVLGGYGPLGRPLPHVRIESLGSPPPEVRRVIAAGLEGLIDFEWPP
eukprot:tig00000692_g3206.t1